MQLRRKPTAIATRHLICCRLRRVTKLMMFSSRECISYDDQPVRSSCVAFEFKRSNVGNSIGCNINSGYTCLHVACHRQRQRDTQLPPGPSRSAGRPTNGAFLWPAVSETLVGLLPSQQMTSQRTTIPRGHAPLPPRSSQLEAARAPSQSTGEQQATVAISQPLASTLARLHLCCPF